MMKPAEAFGQALRSLRTERGLSQESLALASGHDRSYIGLLERGENVPSLDTLFRLAGALGVAPSVFLAQFEAAVDEVPVATPGRGRRKAI
jgi:transcriptional regulator with XRE-family HTH domain